MRLIADTWRERMRFAAIFDMFLPRRALIIDDDVFQPLNSLRLWIIDSAVCSKLGSSIGLFVECSRPGMKNHLLSLC